LRVEVVFPIAGFAEQVLDVGANSFVEGFELNSIAPESSKLKDLNTGWPAQRDRGELLAVISSVQVGGVYRLRTINRRKKEEGRRKKEEGSSATDSVTDLTDGSKLDEGSLPVAVGCCQRKVFLIFSAV
jgi:hypothetical protein